MKFARLYYRLVKFEHTIFALPFAYVGAFLAVDGVPSAHDLLWITLAMVGARSLAMALNRLIDARIDGQNPRTASRELPSGALSAAEVIGFCAASLGLYAVAVFELDPLVRWLSPIPVIAFDVDVDRTQGLHAWAARFGERGACAGARTLHLATLALLVAAGIGLHVGVLYWLGVVAVGCLLLYEHALVRPGDLRRLDAAFFTMNGVISVAFFAFVLADVL